MEQKRLLSLFIAIVMLSGVSTVGFADKIRLSDDDDGKTVITTVGDELVLRLKGNPTTGYQWMIDDVVGKSVVPDGIVEYKATDDAKRVGVGGVFVARFKAVQVGKTTFKLVYARPWGKDKNPDEVFLVTMDVQEAIKRLVKKVKAKYLTHSHGAMEGKRSIAGSGHAVVFETPKGNQKLIAVQIFAARYGMPKPPDESFCLYLLEEDGKTIIKSFKFPYSLIKRGEMKWYLLEFPPTKVPKSFLVALSFNPTRTKGVYLGYTKTDATSFSRVGLPEKGFQTVDKPIEWMMRAFFQDTDAEVIPAVSRADQKISKDLTAKGWKLWKQKKFFEAEELFAEAVKKDPKNAAAWDGLGWSNLNQNKRFDARFDFKKCLAIDPQNSSALNGLGWISKGEGKTDDAIAIWERSLKASPKAIGAMTGLGSTYLEKKDYKQAVLYYNMCLKTEPDNETAKAGLEKARAGRRKAEQSKENQK